MTGFIGLFFLICFPMVSAPVSCIIGKKNEKFRDYFAVFVTALTFTVALLTLYSVYGDEHPPVFKWEGFIGYRMHLTMDGLRGVYAVVTAFMWLVTTVFSREYFAHYRNRNRYYLFSLLTFGSTMGVFLSGDLITTFVFFEIMSFTSYVLVIHDESPAAVEAAQTYIAIAVFGGLALIFGIFILQSQLKTTEIAALYDAAKNFEGDKRMLYIAGLCMLVGFGAKAGMYPLHFWLPNAHPVAPAPASALLSGVLTKTGIYGIIILSALFLARDYSWHLAILIIGTIGMFTGAMLALFSIDLKRILACSSVSQIGFILLGVGMRGILTEKYTSMPIRGTMLHMVNHSLFKLVLFLLAGVVYLNVHKLDLNKIRGFGRGKPLFTFCLLMAVLGIIGMPFWSGYVSKTLLHESLVYHIQYYADYPSKVRIFQIIEGIFTFTGGLTAAYMVKIFVCLCIEKNPNAQEKMTGFNRKYIKPGNGLMLALCAAIVPILGFSPDTFIIPLSTLGQNFMKATYLYDVKFYAWQNVKGAVISLSIGAILYFVIVRGCLMVKNAESRVYVDRWPKFVDLEKRVYRPFLLTFVPFLVGLLLKLFNGLVRCLSKLGPQITILWDKWIVCLSNLGPRITAFWDKWAECSENLGPRMTAFWDKWTAYNEKEWDIKMLYSIVALRNAISPISTTKLPEAEKDACQEKEVNALRDKLWRFKVVLNSLDYGLLLCVAGIAVVLIFVWRY